MNSDPHEGLLGSLLIYVSAIFGVLALLGLPIYYAAQPTVLANVGAGDIRDLLSERGNDGPFPVARLAKPEIFSPAVVTELHARAKEAKEREMQAKRVRNARVAERAGRSRKAHHERAQVRRSFAATRNEAAPFSRQYGSAPY